MGGATSDPDISGLAFAPSGRRLYVGTEGGIAGGKAGGKGKAPTLVCPL